MDLQEVLFVFADVLASSKYEGLDTSSHDPYVDTAVNKAKAEVKREIGLLLLELLAPEKEKNRAALRLV